MRPLLIEELDQVFGGGGGSGNTQAASACNTGAEITYEDFGDDVSASLMSEAQLDSIMNTVNSELANVQTVINNMSTQWSTIDSSVLSANSQGASGVDEVSGSLAANDVGTSVDSNLTGTDVQLGAMTASDAASYYEALAAQNGVTLTQYVEVSNTPGANSFTYSTASAAAIAATQQELANVQCSYDECGTLILYSNLTHTYAYSNILIGDATEIPAFEWTTLENQQIPFANSIVSSEHGHLDTGPLSVYLSSGDVNFAANTYNGGGQYVFTERTGTLNYYTGTSLTNPGTVVWRH